MAPFISININYMFFFESNKSDFNVQSLSDKSTLYTFGFLNLLYASQKVLN